MNYHFADFINTPLRADEKRGKDGEPFQWLSTSHKTVKSVFSLAEFVALG